MTQDKLRQKQEQDIKRACSVRKSREEQLTMVRRNGEMVGEMKIMQKNVQFTKKRGFHFS